MTKSMYLILVMLLIVLLIITAFWLGTFQNMGEDPPQGSPDLPDIYINCCCETPTPSPTPTPEPISIVPRGSRSIFQPTTWFLPSEEDSPWGCYISDNPFDCNGGKIQ